MHIRSQLLFLEGDRERMRLDGALMQQPLEGVPSGSPLSLLLRRPASEAVASAVESTVRRWVDHLDIVDIELLGPGGGAKVQLSDGESTVWLDVDPASFV